jgi:hypothetical protein
MVRQAYEGGCGARLAVAGDADVRDGFRLPRIDAYYLRRIPVPLAVGTAVGRGYMAVRRWGRRLRRSPWDATGIVEASDG